MIRDGITSTLGGEGGSPELQFKLTTFLIAVAVDGELNGSNQFSGARELNCFFDPAVVCILKWEDLKPHSQTSLMKVRITKSMVSKLPLFHKCSITSTEIGKGGGVKGIIS